MPHLFKNAPAIQSLRESEFDAQSAYGEVVDNSLQADASTINIQFQLSPPQHGRKNILAVAFGDDGHGMDEETLHNCLTIGWSSRYNDRSGIGRFGVGMTLGAIHECKRVEVWSKCVGGNWLFTYVDLDEIEKGSQNDIPRPVHQKLPKEYASLVGADHGTLVVWRKYDRQVDDGEDIIRDFQIWAGRTYRYFIWDAVPPRKTRATLKINGEPVKAIDPLYARTELTRFPDDPKADVYPEMVIDWPVDSTMPQWEEGTKSKVTIRMSLLPKEFRQRKGDGDSKTAKARYIDMNEGISILRNHREVFYGPVPYWKSGDGWSEFEAADRWWGCEVLFSPELDRSFQVRNIKRGAIPTKQLKNAIKDKIKPTRKTVLEKVRALWEETEQDDKRQKEIAEADKLVKRAGQHESAEGTAKKAAVPASQLDAGADKNVEAHKAVQGYSTTYSEEERNRLEELFKSQPFTIMEQTWPGQQFFDSKFLGGTAVLDYNMSHPFWVQVNRLVDGLSQEEVSPANIAREIRVMLDLLMIAHAKAEAMFASDAQHSAKDFTDYLRANWGQSLASYVNARLKELA